MNAKTRIGATILALLMSGCTSGAASVATNSPAMSTAPTPTATASPTAMPSLTPSASPIQGLGVAQRIVSRLDDLSGLVATGDGDATGQWANDEGTWVTANMADLVSQDALSEYPTNIIDLLSAVGDGSDQTDAIQVLLSMRNDIATAYSLDVAVSSPASIPKATPVPTPKPISYAKLTSRNWARIVKAPDKYIGNGYQVWGCIFQFDAATGPEEFLASASYKRLEYWALDGETTVFNGSESRLSDFVESDAVLMNVVGTGSYSYDTQAGGNTTVPSFNVSKITRKGSCE